MNGGPALGLYLLASRLAGPLARPILSLRRGRGKEDPERLDERLGHAGRARPSGRLAWLHAASVGEAMSSLALVKALLATDDTLSVLVTTGTVTAARRIGPLLPERALHQFVPVDTHGAVERFLDHWRPDLAVWIESELWPRLVVETSERGVPMAMVNARISAASHARWRRAGGMAASLLGRFDLILAQDRETVDRIAGLGGQARYGGNLKAAVTVAEAEVPEAARGRPVWLAASTHAGEEDVVLTAHWRVREKIGEALLILAPRHPERGDAVASLVRGADFPFARRSASEAPGAGDAVWLADTLGEMDLWYRAAAVTFVGGSLSDRGGHTPFEPISAGSAVVTGPDVANFAPAYAALAKADGVATVRDADTLGDAVAGLLSDAAARAEMVERASGAHRAMVPDVAALARELLSLARMAP